MSYYPSLQSLFLADTLIKQLEFSSYQTLRISKPLFLQLL